MDKTGNLFARIPSTLAEELTEELVARDQFRIERIVSMGHASPKDFWYDQSEHEWVVVLRGEAVLRMQDTDLPLRLGIGDHVHIAPHRKHRVEWTTPGEPTIWLAVCYR